MRILEFDEVASTNTLANEMLARGEVRHGDVITARHQTSGRGRAAGRVWKDEPGESLLMSMVLMVIPEPAHLLQYRAALAVLDALRLLKPSNVTGNEFRLKWPNDILLGEKKVSGLLLEAQWNGTTMRSAVVGIGVNVRQRSFPSELTPTATSLLEYGVDESVEKIRDHILQALEAELHVAPAPEVIARLEEELLWMSQIPSLAVVEGNERRSGLHFEGVDNTGALRLRDEGANIVVIRNGSLSWNKQNG